MFWCSFFLNKIISLYLKYFLFISSWIIKFKKYLTENLLLIFSYEGVKSVKPVKYILIGIVSYYIGHPSIISNWLISFDVVFAF